MARAAVLGRLTWRAATVVAVQPESVTAVTLTLQVPGWPGHLPGQHVDLRLTAADGYTATRAYSLASAADGDHVQLTVEHVVGGEVSSYLTEQVRIGDQMEVRGPVGGWFVWRTDSPGPVQLIGGGSGVVPLMAMLRAHLAERSDTPMRLLYSTRSPETLLYATDLESAAARGVRVDLVYTRATPPGWRAQSGRIDQSLLRTVTFDPTQGAVVYVCGPTDFVETVSALLINAGHDPARIRTERFGPSGGQR